MKYIDYKERREHGQFNFPIAHYRETPRSPRYHMPVHWHTHYEIMWIISGSFHLTLNNDTQEYKAGDVVFITDGILHGGSPHDCVYECFVFDFQALMKNSLSCAKTIHDIVNHKITINTLISKNSDAVVPIVHELSRALSSRRPGYEFMTVGYLYQLLGVIIQENMYEKCVNNTIASERLNAIKNVLTYISENYNRNISLECLAKIAGMNPKYFCRYFRSITERTPIDYLNYYRIESACEMLTTKDVTIKEVAISCGFNDESYFIKTFNKYKGVTPKRYMEAVF